MKETKHLLLYSTQKYFFFEKNTVSINLGIYSLIFNFDYSRNIKAEF